MVPGTEPSTKKPRVRHGMTPARHNRRLPKPATTTLSTSAIGRIDAGTTPKSPNRARYAVAPPCPLVEYRPAANSRLIVSSNSSTEGVVRSTALSLQNTGGRHRGGSSPPR
jgi:hypothetical protein